MNWKRTVGLALLMPALPGAAALTDEMTSDGSQLCPAVADGVRVYADECGGSVTMHISLSELGVQEALLYVGTSSGPVVVRDGMDVEILCDFDSFKVIPVKLVAGVTERSVGIAVFGSRGDTVLVHEQESVASFLDARSVSPRRMDRRDGFARFSSKWNSGELARVVAYRAGDYGKEGSEGIVLLDRSGTVEGSLALKDVRNRLQPGDYVFVHSDGVSDMVANVSIKIEGFMIICK